MDSAAPHAPANWRPRCLKMFAGLAHSPGVSARDGHSCKPARQKIEIYLQINDLDGNRIFLRLPAFFRFPQPFVLRCASLWVSGCARRAVRPRKPGLLRTKALPMSHPNEPRDAVRRNAQSHFTHTERRDELVRQEIEKERAATDAKTAKLRALRLAKEASDQAEAERLAAERAKAGIAAPKSPGRRKRAGRV
jgi:hypothetical protein